MTKEEFAQRVLRGAESARSGLHGAALEGLLRGDPREGIDWRAELPPGVHLNLTGQSVLVRGRRARALSLQEEEVLGLVLPPLLEFDSGREGWTRVEGFLPGSVLWP